MLNDDLDEMSEGEKTKPVPQTQKIVDETTNDD